jgi:hypothetical protein
MTYTLVDSKGNEVDFSSSGGMRDMLKVAPPSLKKFIEKGIADKSLSLQIQRECATIKTLAYLKPLLAKLTAPIAISDGVM